MKEEGIFEIYEPEQFINLSWPEEKIIKKLNTMTADELHNQASALKSTAKQYNEIADAMELRADKLDREEYLRNKYKIEEV